MAHSPIWFILAYHAQGLHQLCARLHECQMHGPIQHVPDVPLQPIIKLWPGRGWALDFIGEIHPNSSLQHKHILLATDFFTKWVETIPVKTTSSEVITDFIFKYIITRYGIPECLVADRGAGFMAERTQKFLAGYVLPIEINVQSLRVREQHQLIGEDYVQAMYQEHEDLDSRRVEALDSLMAEKKKIARLYDKCTRGRSFGVGDLVWKACFPYGERVDGRGKWSAKWEGHFVIDRVMGKGAYYLRDTDGNVHRNPMNGRHLKKYFPSVWEYEDPPAAVQAK
ncbi:uncharacterized protein LOC126802927 [Argentina anserina]|uniref:uncharacterized protein LOC126802927 n=1 Tax=Argentina anserina TaxID=57926 RepID=UPI0021766CC8|nr:uncharacterized protein LOC126802927 [Potentilla anserina]